MVRNLVKKFEELRKHQAEHKCADAEREELLKELYAFVGIDSPEAWEGKAHQLLERMCRLKDMAESYLQAPDVWDMSAEEAKKASEENESEVRELFTLSRLLIRTADLVDDVL